MKFIQPISLESIAELINARIIGDPSYQVQGINEIHRVEPGDIVFVDHPKYYEAALNSKATVVIIDKEVDCPEGKHLLIHSAPFDAFNTITRKHRPYRNWNQSIGENFTCGANTDIHPNAVIGHEVIIGDNCVIHSGVVLADYTVIGNNVTVQANSVIGGAGFYYKKKPTGYDRMHTCGNVILENNVEIGALCSIDAGVTSSTVIGEGTKLDNQVHIGHDTIVGKNCLMAAQVGVSGCVIIEDNVTLWGQSGVVAGVTLKEGSTVLGMSGVGKDLEPGKSYLGAPAKEAREKWRELAALSKLPELIKKLK